MDNQNSNENKNLPDYAFLKFPNKTQLYIYEYKDSIEEVENNFNEYEDKATFNPELFFNIFLPPIIFNAGYEMKRVKNLNLLIN